MDTPHRDEPFRFLCLPPEIRMMIYEHSLDNCVFLNEARHPAWCETTSPFISNIFYPSMLRVNKQISAEFTPLCLSNATLCVAYTPNGSESGKVVLPVLSKWFDVPADVLARFQHVDLKLEVVYKLPNSNPFEGISNCLAELSSLKHILVWAQVSLSALDQDVETGGGRCKMLISYFDDIDIVLYETACSRRFSYQVGFDAYCRLYSLTAETALCFGRDLQCRDIPATGLPEWGYAMFLEASHLEPDPTDFDYHNAKLRFDCIDYDLYVPY